MTNEIIDVMLPVKAQSTAIVRPPVSVEEAVQAFQMYQELENKLLTDTDYMYFVYYKDGQYDKDRKFRWVEEAEEFCKKVKGKVVRRKIKSAWRKFATFFGLTLPDPTQITNIEYFPLPENMGMVKIERGAGWSGQCYMDAGMNVVRQEYTISVIHPASGKTFIGMGACAASERKSGRNSFAHPDHDIIGTAWTRSLNRAISDLVGFGEVSGEEIASLGEEIMQEAEKPTESTSEKPPKPKVTKETKEEISKAKPVEKLPSPPKAKDDQEKGPQAVKLWLIAESTKREWGGPPTNAQLGLLNGLLNEILGGDKERHTWLKWTFEVDSSKELSGGRVACILDKLASTKDAETGKYIPTNEKFVQAIKAMFKQALIDAGQPVGFEEAVEELWP